tara:strand:+ start:2004 stop:2237 length:234 start_codon:yes stop_codon:yes gene_type:complete
MVDRYTRGYDETRHRGTRMGTLWADHCADGDVTMSPYFDELDHVSKIDVLNDLIVLLERERDVLIRMGEFDFKRAKK